MWVVIVHSASGTGYPLVFAHTQELAESEADRLREKWSRVEIIFAELVECKGTLTSLGNWFFS